MEDIFKIYVGYLELPKFQSYSNHQNCHTKFKLEACILRIAREFKFV